MERVKGMKAFRDNKGAAFDIAEEDKAVFDDYIKRHKEGKIHRG